MQTDYLRYFVDVAELGSMSSAAKKNYMTPQGVSRSIAALENELGCVLLVRDSNKVSLTHYGDELLKYARDVLESESQLRRRVYTLQAKNVQTRKIDFTCYSSPIFFDTPLFFPASGLGTFHYKRVRFLQRPTPEVVDLLLDAARLTDPNMVVVGGLGMFSLFSEENAEIIAKLSDAGYEYRPFMLTTDYVLVPAYSNLAKQPALSKAEIRKHRLAVAANGGMERAIARHIGTDSIYVSSGDSAYRNYLCRMGEALTFVPGLALVFGVPEGTVAVPMEESYEIEIGFAARPAEFEKGILPETIARLHDFYAKNRQENEYRLCEEA